MARETNDRLRRLEEMHLSFLEYVQKQRNDHQEINPCASMFKQVSNLRPPSYAGQEDPTILENWIREFEKVFTAAGTEDALKVNLATYYLRNEADRWWSMSRATLQASPDFCWDAFLVALRGRFYPEHIRRQKHAEFAYLKQGGMSISDYARKFNELARFAPTMIPDERAKAQKFEDGLSYTIQSSLGGVSFDSFHEIYTRACNIERVANLRNASSGSKRPMPSSSSAPRKWNKKHFNSSRIRQQIAQPCSRCRQHHPGRPCATRTITCFRCGAPGHKANQCPRSISTPAPQHPNPARNPVTTTVGAASSSRPNAKGKGRIFVMSQTEAEAEANVIAGRE